MAAEVEVGVKCVCGENGRMPAERERARERRKRHGAREEDAVRVRKHGREQGESERSEGALALRSGRPAEPGKEAGPATFGSGSEDARAASAGTWNE